MRDILQKFYSPFTLPFTCYIFCKVFGYYVFYHTAYLNATVLRSIIGVINSSNLIFYFTWLLHVSENSMEINDFTALWPAKLSTFLLMNTKCNNQKRISKVKYVL